MAEPKTKAAKAAAAPARDDSKLQAVRVRAAGVASRYRIGRQFTAEPVEIPAADLDADDVTALLADPHLAVELIGE